MRITIATWGDIWWFVWDLRLPWPGDQQLKVTSNRRQHGWPSCAIESLLVRTSVCHCHIWSPSAKLTGHDRAGKTLYSSLPWLALRSSTASLLQSPDHEAMLQATVFGEIWCLLGPYATVACCSVPIRVRGHTSPQNPKCQPRWAMQFRGKVVRTLRIAGL